VKNKPEFQLALGIFVLMSVVGTAFGLWWAGRYAAVKPRTNVDAATETAAPPPNQESPPRGTPDSR